MSSIMDDGTNTGAPPPYDDNSEFNDYLNSHAQLRENGEIIIGEVTLQASDILYQMDPFAYQDALALFQEQQTKDFKDIIIDSFPTPLASRFYRIEQGWKNWGQRFSMLKDFWETLTYVLYGLILGEVLSRHIGLLGAEMADTNRRDKQIKTDDLVSDKLSDRLSVIAGILDYELQQGIPTKAIQLIPRDVINQIRSLNKVRNGVAHGETMSELQAQEAYETCYPKVLYICQELAGLKDVQSLLKKPHATGYLVKVVRLRAIDVRW